MATVQEQRVLSVDELMQAAVRLPAEQLEQLIALLQTLHTPQPAPDESELLQRINEGLPDESWERYDVLTTKQQAETITAAERIELSCLLEQLELLQAQRIDALIQLAALRQVPLDALMASLGIRPRASV